MRTSVRASVGISTLFLCGVSSGALAQSAAPASPADAAQTTEPSPATNASPDGGAADIIVTAQRRDESLSRTPVAVQIVGAKALEDAQVKNELDLRFATPGLQIRSGQSSNSISYSLRGQSQDPQSDTRPGVLPYFNEIPLAGQGSTTAFYDLASVQVLKGPQGTLFGRSATGGAVLYTTQKPTEAFGGYVSGLLGNYAAHQLEGALNVPLAGDRVLVRLAGFYSERHGMQHSFFTGDRIGDIKRTGLRGSVTLKPSDTITNTTVFDYFHAHGQNTQATISGLLRPFTGAGAPYFPGELVYAGTATPEARAIGIGTVQAVLAAQGQPPEVLAGVPGFYDAYFSQPTHLNTGLDGVLAQQLAVGPYRPLGTSRNFYGATNYLVTNTTAIELAPRLNLKNIFGYYHQNTDSSMDVDTSPYGLQDNLIGPLVDTRQTTDELQLSGDLIDRRLSFVTGLFYSKESTPYFLNGNFFDILLGGGPNIYHHKGTSKTLAGYAQATYKLTDQFSILGGVRYTSEKLGKIIYSDDLNAGFCGVPGYDCDQSRKFHNLNYTLGVQYQATPQFLLYATTRQAYKNGGFNGFLAPKVGTGAENGGDGFDTQRVRDAEAGAKFQGHAGAMPVRANLALYYTWIRNDQRVAYVLNPGPGTEIVNVPRGRTYGLEFDGQFVPARWLTVGGTFNYTNAKFTNGSAVVTTSNGVSNSTSQVLYDQVPDTPKASGSVFADVRVPVYDAIDAVLHGDFYFQDRSFGAPRSFNGAAAGTNIPSYQLVNFRVGVEDEPAGWSLTANLKNAFNKTYYTGVFALGEVYQVNSHIVGERRTFTVEARFKF